MRRSKTEIYLHLVWATRLREACLVGELKDRARNAVTAEARSLGCEVLALDGVEDHLHLLARVPGRISAAELAKQVKGVSSHAITVSCPPGRAFAGRKGTVPSASAVRTSSE